MHSMKIRFTLLILFFAQTVSILAANTKIQPALNGIYTIGGTTPDYATFTAAIAALTSQGITGPTTFNVRPGTYTEQITIGQITGASVNNPITFISTTSDSTTVTLTYASSAAPANNFTLKFDGADYITFRNMTIQRSGSSSYGTVIEMSNTSNSNYFMHNRIIGGVATSTGSTNSLIYSPNTSGDNNNTFSNNAFTNGSYGIYFYGQGSTTLEQGNSVLENTFTNQYYCAIAMAYQTNVVVNDNVIVTNSAYGSIYGIFTFYCDNATRILRNKVSLPVGGYGIYLSYCDGAAAQHGEIANNFVSFAGASTAIGIGVNLSTAQNIYYNSVNITNTNTISKAFAILGLVSANIDIKNNVFANVAGYSYYIDDNAMSSITQSNYNDLYTLGTNIGYFGTSGNQVTMANWQTAAAQDNNSVSGDPAFNSAIDLHSASGLLNGHAIPLTSASTPVTSDIDGQTRNTSTPDIGADEFSIEDVGVSDILYPTNLCKNSTGYVKIVIKNFGVATFTGSVPVSYQISGGSLVNANTGSVTIASGDTLEYTFTSPITFSIAGSFTCDASTNLTGDINTSNNSFTSPSFQIWDLPAIDAGADQSMCLGDSVVLTATGGTSYLWNTTQTAAQITVIPVLTTEYHVTATDNNGCSAADSVSVNVDTTPAPIANFSYVLNGLDVTFTNLSTNTSSYSWDFGDGNTSTLQNPENFYPSSSNYTVTLIASNNCGADTFSQNISVVGIQEYLVNEKLNIYPNPSNGNFSIDLTLVTGKDAEIKILDELGKEMVIERITLGSIKHYNFADLCSGVYQVLLITDKKIYSQKVIIQ